MIPRDQNSLLNILQITCLIMDLYLKYIKDPYNSIIKEK